MAGVIEGVEANQIAVEQRFEDLVADGERAVELRRREGAVQEEPDAEAVESAAQEGGEGEEVVVVDPDVVVLGVEDLDDALGEELVGEDVGLPVGAASGTRRGVEMSVATSRQGGRRSVEGRDSRRGRRSCVTSSWGGRRMGEDEGDDEIGLSE